MVQFTVQFDQVPAAVPQAIPPMVFEGEESAMLLVQLLTVPEFEKQIGAQQAETAAVAVTVRLVTDPVDPIW